MRRRHSEHSGFRSTGRKKVKIVTGKLLFRLSGCLLAILAISATGFAGWGWIQECGIFKITSVYISGCNRLERSELIEMIAKASKGEDNLIRIDTNMIEKGLEGAPWISKAHVFKKFPDRLVIKITERTPFAFVNSDKFYVADETGVIFMVHSPKDGFSLPIITGITISQDDSGNLWHADPMLKKGFMAALELIRLSSRGIRTLGMNNISEIAVQQDNSIILYTADRAVPFLFGYGNKEELRSRFAKAEKILYHLYRSGKYSEVDRVDINFIDNMALAHLGRT